MVKDVVILGAGGHAREVADVVVACIAAGARLRLVGFVDDDEDKHGLMLTEGPILGDTDALDRFSRRSTLIVAGVGAPGPRRRLVEAATAMGFRSMVLIHPTVSITRHVEIATGVVITAGCVVTNQIELGEHCHINRMTTVGHDCRVGAFVHLAPAAVLSGNVTVEDDCYIGTNATIIQGLTIGRGAIVGAGAVVVHDVPSHCTVVGVPARILRRPAEARIARASAE